jgi:predicted protein tyrosine phosphatase
MTVSQSTMNQIGNAKNPAQGQAKRVLTVCSAGLLRSPTTADWLTQEYGYNTRACGSVPEFALVPITDVLVHWADEIVFAEELHKIYAKNLISDSRYWEDEEGNTKPLIVLDIPDIHMRNDKYLIHSISEAYINETKKIS